MAKWRAQHEGEMIDQPGARFSRELFYRCTFRNVRGALFDRCAAIKCVLAPRTIQDLLSVTATLDCLALDGLELNELAFDAALYMLARTDGNYEKRKQVRQLIEPERMRRFEELFARLERWRAARSGEPAEREQL
jgi:hypothetical protein